MSNNIGQKIKIIRESLNLSQAKFCELLDIGLSGYKKYETGISEPGAGNLEKIANHPQTKMYFLWLFTGETNPALGQIAPGDAVPEGKLSEEQFEEQFIDTAVGSLMMFCHLDWFTPNKDKKVDFNDCGKLLLKDLRPIIDARATNTSSNQKMA
ncbi:helix-turn-helix domain-containing protein [Pseudoalteromonas sp. 68 DY56-GL68]|uniref:helix-turn-helix domain-containing protein n=1 Tax=Pseudoalteromonas sp. 68 DY56-GL68 TaxID=2974919 RepID=UPI00352AEA2E